MDDGFLRWLENLGLSAYAETFRANDVDFEALPYLDDSDLKELGVSLGHRRRLLAAAAELAPRPPVEAPAPAPVAPLDDEEAVERRLLTVMFVDMVDSTPLAESLDPEDLHELIRSYQIAVTAAVVRYEGYVAKFLGDGVLAYFGWPLAHEDEAERAVRAARDALAAIKRIGEKGKIALQARAGIASGEVVVGNIVGELASDDAAAIGATPGLADRLQRVAGPFEIVIGPMTRQLLGSTFEVEDLGARDLKGFAEPVPVWRVLGVNPAETRFEASHGEPLAGLVGRTHELGLLRDRWDLAKEGEGQVVLLVGEAGIGKSRLVQEFRREIADDPRFGFRYQCSPHHTNSAFYPVIQQLRRAAGISDEDSPKVKQQKIETLLKLTPGHFENAAPLLSNLLRIPADPAAPPLNMPPQQLRQRTTECLVAQVSALSRRHAILLVIEDAHWADPSMLDYASELIKGIEDQRVLMVVTYRTELETEWPDRSHLTAIMLNRIGRRHSTEIAEAIAGQGLGDGMISQIVQRADGVPLHVEELTKTALESETATGEGADPVPTSLHTSLVARLDRLGEAKKIAQIGSVIGREFRHDLLSELAKDTQVAIDEALDRLVASGLVVRRGAPPMATYNFKHALVQDAAYATLLVSRRKRLHRAIVEMLEALLDAENRENIDLIAHHAMQAKDWTRAFDYFKEAGEDAVARSALPEAAGLLKQALAASRNLEESPELFKQTVALLFQLRNVLWALGQFEEILQYLEDAERLAIGLGDEVLRGWVSVYRGASLWQVGRSDLAKAAVSHGREIGEAHDDLSLQVAANFYLGCAHVTSGEFRVAEVYFKQVIDALPGELAEEKCGLPFAPSIISRSWLVWSLAERGEFSTADTHARFAVNLADATGHPFNRAHIYYDVGYFQMVRGDLKGAISTLDNAVDLIESWSLTYLSPFTVGFLGYAHLGAGDTEGAIRLLEEAVESYERIRLGLFKSLVGVQLASAYLRADRVEEACARLERALRTARERGESGHETHGLLVLGDLAARALGDGGVEAKRIYERVLKRSRELGMMPLEAQCRKRIARMEKGEATQQPHPCADHIQGLVKTLETEGAGEARKSARSPS